jgi:hypothetical protein
MSTSDPLPTNEPIVKLSIPENILNETETETTTEAPIKETPKEEEGVPNISYEEFKEMKDEISELKKHNKKLLYFMKNVLTNTRIMSYGWGDPMRCIDGKRQQGSEVNKYGFQSFAKNIYWENDDKTMNNFGFTDVSFENWLNNEE